LTDKGRRRKINEIIENEEGIAMASEVLISISKDEVERARLMSEYKYQLDMQSKLVHAKREARREGIQEGMKEGRQEEKENTARNALARGYSIDAIHDLTGLDIEIIKSLKTPEKSI
jgi:predicted transposase/invertase (TIGR01784 family)